jgi:hypothetical protein
MTKLNGLSLAIAALLVAACDPYPSAAGGSAQVVTVTAANTQSGAGGPVEMTQTGGAWSGTACTFTNPDNNTTSLDTTAIHIQFNKQLNGLDVQTSPSDCTPTNGWLSVAVTGTTDPADETWYSCYSPSSPDPALGGSVVVYRARKAAPPELLVSSGWADAFPDATSSTAARGLDPAGTYHITGTVEGAPIDVTLSGNGTTCPEE